MRIIKLITIAFALLFFSTCKKDEKADENAALSYPATFVFSVEGVEETTAGLVAFNNINGEFVVQNTRYSPKSKRTKTIFYTIDSKKNSGVNIINSVSIIFDQSGNYQRTGNIQNTDFGYYGISAYTKPVTFETDFVIHQSSWTTLQDVRKFTESNLAISKIMKVKDGYLLVGAKINSGDRNVVVIKYDQSLNTKLWEKEFGGAGNDMAMDAIELCDGNYGILAYTYSKGAGDRDVWYLKLDVDGSLISELTYGGVGYEEPQKIISMVGNNCELIIAGHSSSYRAPEHDGYILKINENGAKIWEKTFGTANHDGFNTITNIPQTNNYIAAGRSMQGMGQPEDVFVVCFDDNGNELWRKKYGDPTQTELPEDIVADSEFYYLMCNRVDATGNFSAIFVKDKLGN